MRRPRNRPSRALAALAATLALLAPACTSGGDHPRDGLSEHYDPPPPPPPREHTMGERLLLLSKLVEQWDALSLEGRTTRDESEREGYARHLRQETREHWDELSEELETGPTRNRQVLATALGFSEMPEALGLLLAALGDPDPTVQSNALLGLAVLGDPETPLGEICETLRGHHDPVMRSHAAMAIDGVLRAGSGAECVVEACRAGLFDEDPAVASQCCIALARAGDAESIPTLADMLYDERNFVVLSAARAISHLGEGHPEWQGRAARALASPLDRVDRVKRDILLRELRYLRGRDLGSDAEDWVRWAHQLP